MKTNNISFLIAFSVINAFSFHASAALTGSEILKVNKGGTVNKIYTSNLPTLKVATYNIGKNEAADNVKDLTHLSQAIGKINADIIAVTEIDNQTQRSGKINQLADIAQANHLFYAFGKALDFDGGEYGVGLLSKYKIDKSQVINLPSGEAEQRVVLISQLAVPGFDSPVIVMTTHLDWQKNPEVRLNQARYLLDLSIGDAPSDFANIASAVKILAGDFNSTANEQPVKKSIISGIRSLKTTSIFEPGPLSILLWTLTIFLRLKGRSGTLRDLMFLMKKRGSTGRPPAIIYR